MYAVALASQKGGSGKTTLSGHLAVEAQNANIGPVAVIDTDPQGSLSQWWNAREAATPLFARVGLLELGAHLAELEASGVKLAVIDTPPAITESISRVIAHVDLVILPTRPSPHDLRAVGATVNLAERYQKPVLFVINGATPRARITGEAAVALSQHGTVAPVTVHHRVDFAASMVDGRTVGEVVPKSASAREIRELWIYLQDRLARLKHDATIAPEIVPQHFAVSALSGSAGADLADLGIEDPATVEVAQYAPPPPPPFPDGIDRRSGQERRRPSPDTLFKGPERRAHAFGRRSADDRL